MPSKRKPQPQRKSKLTTLVDFLTDESDESDEESTAEEAIVVRNKKKTTQMPSRRSAPQSSKVPTRRAPTRGKKIVEVESELSDLTSSDTEEIEEVEDNDAEVVPNKRGRGSASKKPATKSTAKKMSTATTSRKNSRAAAKSKTTTKIQDTSTATDDETSQKSTAEEDGNTKPLSKRGKATATAARRVLANKRLTKKEREAQAQAEREIAETQYTPMDVDESTEEEEEEEGDEEEYGGKDRDGKSDEEDKDEVEEVGEEDEEDDVTSAQPPPIAASRKRSAPAAAQRQQPATKKVILSKSENTTVEDALRSQLEEMTRRYEEADRRLKELTKLKYTDAEIALIEYKETMQARIDASEKLNATLQEDLKAYQTFGAENKKLKKELKDKDTEINKLATKITTFEQALFESDTEIKSLNAKLTVARQATSAPPPPPSASSQPIIPGSAVKPKPQPHTNGHHHHHHHHHSHASTPSTNAIPWEILAKEELYGDLTALTVLGVKVFPEQPDLRVYDCIQTGKNGTLHFKLTTPINGTNEEDEFTFTPHLDPQRDAKILSLLPEYLTEEITFGRGNATRFYLKLLGVVLRNENHGARQGSGSVGPAGGGEEE